MKKEINSTLTRITVFLFVLLSGVLKAEEEKFNLGGNEPVDKGPMFIGAVAGTIVVFGLLLFLKIRYDRKKKREIHKQMKMQAKNMATTRSRAQTRTSSSRTRGATS